MMYLNEDDEEGFSTLEEGLTVTYDVFKSNYVIVIQFASYCLTVTYDAFKFLLLTWFESFEIRLTVTYDVSNSI